MDGPDLAPITGNAAIEDAAIAYALAYELDRGWVARGALNQGVAGGVVSTGRIIEVKAYGGSERASDLWLETRQVAEARTNPLVHLYVIDNVRQGDPRRLGNPGPSRRPLSQLLDCAKEQRFYTVPFLVAVHDG